MAKQDDGYARRALTRTLQDILDLVADLKKEGRFDVLKEDLGETEDQTTAAVRMLIIDPQIRTGTSTARPSCVGTWAS